MSPEALDSVATFYNLIFRRPVGENVILLCGQRQLLDHGLRGHLRPTSRRVSGWSWGKPRLTASSRCSPWPALGTCDRGPAMMVGNDLQPEPRQREGGRDNRPLPATSGGLRGPMANGSSLDKPLTGDLRSDGGVLDLAAYREGRRIRGLAAGDEGDDAGRRAQGGDRLAAPGPGRGGISHGPEVELRAHGRRRAPRPSISWPMPTRWSPALSRTGCCWKGTRTFSSKG